MERTVVTKLLEGRSRAVSKVDADDAFIALLIAAMDASGHVSAEEAARAHNIIWSMRRFRHRSGRHRWPQDRAHANARREARRFTGHRSCSIANPEKASRGRLRRGSGSCARRRQDGAIGRTVSQTARCRSWTRAAHGQEHPGRDAPQEQRVSQACSWILRDAAGSTKASSSVARSARRHIAATSWPPTAPATAAARARRRARR